jgi:hypothetical protein
VPVADEHNHSLFRSDEKSGQSWSFSVKWTRRTDREQDAGDITKRCYKAEAVRDRCHEWVKSLIEGRGR